MARSADESAGHAWRSGLAPILVTGILLATAAGARAQDDGPRVYQLAPEGAKAFTAFTVVKRGNETPESGDIVTGSQIDTNLLVLRYVQTFDLGGRQFSPFFILPTGLVRSTVHSTTGKQISESSGFGDAQIGG